MNSVEIAKLAGVSRTTVSRVINNSGYVKEETRSKIQSLMDKYNFVPSESARRLAGAKVSCVGLFIIDIDSPISNRRISHSDYFSHVTTQIIDQANSFNQDVLVTLISSEHDMNKLRNLHKNNSIGSGIIIGPKNTDLQLETFRKIEYPTIIIDLDPAIFHDIPNVCCINFDNINGSYLITKELISRGYTDIVHITGDLIKLSGAERKQGFVEAMKESALPIPDSHLIHGQFSEQIAHANFTEFIKSNNTDAVFCANDIMALGIIRAANELGLSIPKDFALVGFDNNPIGEYCQPTLTTVDIPFDNLAFAAINALEHYNQYKSFSTKHIVLPTQVILRNSH